MSIAFDSSLITSGSRVGGVSEKNRPTVGWTISGAPVGSRCSCMTRSLPGSSVHARSAGSMNGTLPGDQPNTFCT